MQALGGTFQACQLFGHAHFEDIPPHSFGHPYILPFDLACLRILWHTDTAEDVRLCVLPHDGTDEPGVPGCATKDAGPSIRLLPRAHAPRKAQVRGCHSWGSSASPAAAAAAGAYLRSRRKRSVFIRVFDGHRRRHTRQLGPAGNAPLTRPQQHGLTGVPWPHTRVHAGPERGSQRDLQQPRGARACAQYACLWKRRHMWWFRIGLSHAYVDLILNHVRACCTCECGKRWGRGLSLWTHVKHNIELFTPGGAAA